MERITILFTTNCMCRHILTDMQMLPESSCWVGTVYVFKKNFPYEIADIIFTLFFTNSSLRTLQQACQVVIT